MEKIKTFGIDITNIPLNKINYLAKLYNGTLDIKQNKLILAEVILIKKVI
jgi:hypothetical protein